VQRRPDRAFKALTSSRLVLSTRGAGAGRIAGITLLAAALPAIVIGIYAQPSWSAGAAADPQLVALQQQVQQLHQQLEQAQLQQRMASAHGQELERQIGTFNTALRVCKEDLGFYRSARGTNP
jgi:hypothetical protein